MSKHLDSAPSLRKIVIVGAGNMGGAIAQRWLEQAPQYAYHLIERSSAPDWLQQGERVHWSPVTASAEALDKADIVLLAVKPAQVDEVAALVQPSPECTLVSVMAGVRLQRLQQLFAVRSIYRVMPNTPFRVGRGVSVLCGESQHPQGQQIEQLFALGGQTLWAPEDQMDLMTTMVGSVPAFVFLLAETLEKIVADAGFSPQQAQMLVANVVAGAGELLVQSGKTPQALREAVTSPNGVTQKGLELLGEGGFESLLADAVKAATERSAELG